MEWATHEAQSCDFCINAAAKAAYTRALSEFMFAKKMKFSTLAVTRRLMTLPESQDQLRVDRDVHSCFFTNNRVHATNRSHKMLGKIHTQGLRGR